jgi:hypothetical protein
LKIVFLLPFLLTVTLFAQDSKPAAQVVSFTFSNSKMMPSEYAMQLSNDCSMTYAEKGGGGDGELVEQKGTDEDEPAPKAFAASPRAKREEERVKRVNISKGTCQQVFELAKQAKYFDGDFEFRKHNVAYTGDRVLGYLAPGVSRKTVFTWSDNPAIQQLSATFEGIAATIEAGPQLEREYKFEPLGLNQKLAAMLDRAQKGYLRELALIEPTLSRIANDPKVMHIARQRASKLLEIAKSGRTSTR